MSKYKPYLIVTTNDHDIIVLIPTKIVKICEEYIEVTNINVHRAFCMKGSFENFFPDEICTWGGYCKLSTVNAIRSIYEDRTAFIKCFENVKETEDAIFKHLNCL